MDANNLEYENEKFDVIFGGGMLHHLEFERAVYGILRVLKKDGVAIFVEPLNLNFISKIIRYLTPNHRTIDETPLEMKHLQFLKDSCNCKFYYEQFLSVPLGLLSGIIFKNPENFLTKIAFTIDNFILKTFPFIGPYFRSTTILIRKK